MNIRLSEQVGDFETIRENFKKIKEAFLTVFGLPDMTDKEGYFLTNDGFVPLWKAISRNIDGGFPGETYLPTQKIDGGEI